MIAQTKTYTIGFTGTTAERFFERLMVNRVHSIIDVRLSNSSQLSGFAKVPDLPYFLKRVAGIEYRAEPLLAPTEDLLATYRAKKIRWADYEISYLALLRSREVEKRLSPEMFNDACLLCSEALPHQCHRRLALNYLSERWGADLTVSHL